MTDVAALTWDTYGNLTLTNDAGNGKKVSWGVGASAPLTGADKASLCQGSGTNG